MTYTIDTNLLIDYLYIFSNTGLEGSIGRICGWLLADLSLSFIVKARCLRSNERKYWNSRTGRTPPQAPSGTFPCLYPQPTLMSPAVEQVSAYVLTIQYRAHLTVLLCWSESWMLGEMQGWWERLLVLQVLSVQ